MTVKLYLAADVDTAFAHAVQHIREVQQGNPLQTVSLLVPTAEVVQAVRRLLGDVFGVTIYQFYGLGQAILNATGQSFQWLSDAAVSQLVRRLLADMAKADELSSFAQVWALPGFQQAVLDWLREMKSQGITPESFSEHAASTCLERDRQLSELYNRYQHFLQERQLSDSDGLLWLAAEAMEADTNLFCRQESFLVLGFDQFNPIQERILKRLAERSTDFLIYLPWDPERSESSLALSRLAETRHQLQDALQDCAFSESLLPAARTEIPILRYLRRTLFEPIPNSELELDDWEEDTPVRLWEAPSREMEVRLALREIKRLLLKGAPAEEIALLAPQPDIYQRLVELVAEEYGILVEQEYLLRLNPAVQALQNVLALPGEFSWRQTLEALRSPYFHRSWLTAEQVDLLEALSRERPVLKGREQWFFALEPAEVRYPEAFESEDLGPARLVQSLQAEILDGIRQGLVTFFNLLTPPETGTPREYVFWIQETILGLRQPVEAESDPVLQPTPSLEMAACIQSFEKFRQRDIEALRAVLQILRNLVEALELVGLERGSTVSWVEFRKTIQDMLLGAVIPADPLAQIVRFDRLEGGRGKPLDHLFVLGLSEGEFPTQAAPDPFYSFQERAQKGLPLRRLQPDADAALWWLVVSGCRKSLTLFRPYLDENGTPWEPSPYWEAVQEKASLRAKRIPVAAVPGVEEAASLAEFVLALGMANPRAVPTGLESTWQAVLHTQAVMRKRQSWISAPVYEGYLQAPDLQAELAARYSERYTWSASRLNQYGMCPFGFFAQSVLKLEERLDPVEGFDPLQRGSLLHEILEGLHTEIQVQGLFMAPQHLDTTLVLLEQACSQVFARAPQRYGFRPGAIWRYEQDDLRRLLRALVTWECDQENSFHPYRQELRFGLVGADLPRYRFVDSDGLAFFLHGVIDRIDRDEDRKVLRVLDYKSGSTEFTKSDLESGRALQTALYAMAAEGLLGEPVQESAYVLLPKRKLSGQLTAESGIAENETAQQALDKAGEFIRQIRRGTFPSLPSKPTAGSMTCSSYCSFSSLCRVDRRAVAKARRFVQ